MSSRHLPAAVVVLIVLAFPLAVPAQPKVALPERFRQWLDEEVVYIITSHEREVFLHLTTDRERDMFIEAFWKQRDPTPGTPQNKFREEHYRRLKHANDIYGRSSPVPGWRTDRGRTYIVLGPPKNIESYSNVQNVYPVEIWFYYGDPALGLPTAFNVIFFKRNGIGDYVFYSPAQDGPQSLLTDSLVSGEDPEKAYQTLKTYEPNLAYQVLSLIPGERQPAGTISLASTKLMATIFASPQKKVEDAYADAILKYKDFIEVEYTANYVPSDAAAQVIRDATGAFLVHYTIEPGKVTVEDAGGKYDVHFLVTGRVSDASGRTITQFDREFPFSLTRDALEAVRAQSISLQDMFPLIPGTYKLDLLIRNTASKEFASAECPVVVPGPDPAPRLSPLLLAYKVEGRADASGGVPFAVGRQQILCQSRKSYGTKDTLVLFYQVYGLTPELRAAGSFLLSFRKEDKPFSTRVKKLSEYGAGDDFLEVQDLASFPPGYYQAVVSLHDGQGREVAGSKGSFEVITLPAVPRPVVMAKVRPEPRREDSLYETGLQFYNSGDRAEALARLSEAHRLDPARLEFAVALGQVLFVQGDYQRVKETLAAFSGGEQPAAEVLSLLGRACHALGQFEEAVTYYTGY
ncbi:MAG TPA: GWxTD domain-containing protein, partial [Burkholderiales bacterium]|nr:GWxTD domain-containing protein [Burkholderiales bacterium]